MHFLNIFLLFLLACTSQAAKIEGRVVAVLTESRSLKVQLISSETMEFTSGNTREFRVGIGDLDIGYKGRTIRANATFYGKKWHLEHVFPTNGIGSKAAADVNMQLHHSTATMSRRKYVKQGEYIPNFAMIDQNGEFLQIRQLLGKPFIMNFIFTRCTVPKMCPASSERMSTIQDMARELGLKDLHFVTISFDPEFDSPGILRQYAKGYSIEDENFYLLTGDLSAVDNLLRQFGIITIEEDGTINHTMATLLVDRNGRVAYRKEGTDWTVEEFIEASYKL